MVCDFFMSNNKHLRHKSHTNLTLNLTPECIKINNLEPGVRLVRLLCLVSHARRRAQEKLNRLGIKSHKSHTSMESQAQRVVQV